MKRILAYVLFVIGFILVIALKQHLFDINSILLYFLGVALFIGGVFYLRSTPTSKEVKLQENIKKELKVLMKNGELINVDLTQCKIKEHNYSEERERYGHDSQFLTLDIERDIQALNYLGGDSVKNVDRVTIIQSVIIFEYENPQLGKKEKFVSRVIPKDKITLSIYLDKQKRTNLYVDKNNRENYYFDLDFLNID